MNPMKRTLKNLLSHPFFRHALQTVVMVALIRHGIITPEEARVIRDAAPVPASVVVDA